MILVSLVWLGVHVTGSILALFCGGAASSNCGFPLGRGTLIVGPLGERVCFAYHHWPQPSAAASVQLVAGAGS